MAGMPAGAVTRLKRANKHGLFAGASEQLRVRLGDDDIPPHMPPKD